MESIPVKSLGDKELKQAITDWSEGNRHLKKLLWRCYKAGVETSGCHSGHRKSTPYVDFQIEGTARTKLRKILSSTLDLGDAEVFLSFGGNPWSGPDWYKPVVLTAPLKVEYTTIFFKSLIASLKEKKESQNDEIVKAFMDIYESMRDRETPLKFRMRVYEGECYKISIECFENNRDWKYYTELFTSIGFKEERNPRYPDSIILWENIANGREEIKSMLQELNYTLKTKWTLELPEEITEDMSVVSRALLMRRKFGTDRKGIELLNKWLNDNKEPGMDDVNY